jgi:NADPH:quinone reductase
VGKFYGFTMLYRKDPKLLREDLAKIFALLAQKKVDPLVNRTLPLLEVRQALELPSSDSVECKILLTNFYT